MHEREGWSLLSSLVGLAVLGVLVGFTAALWVAGAMILSVGVNRWLPAVLAGSRDRPQSRLSVRQINAWHYTGVRVAIIAAILLFVFLGWLPALVFVVLIFGYYVIS